MIQKKLIITLFLAAILGGGEIWAQDWKNEDGLKTVRHRSLTLSYAPVTHRFQPLRLLYTPIKIQLGLPKRGTALSLLYNTTVLYNKRYTIDFGMGLTYIENEIFYQFPYYYFLAVPPFVGQSLINEKLHYKNLFLDIPANIKFNVYKKRLWIDAGFNIMVVLAPMNEISVIGGTTTPVTANIRTSGYDFGIFGGMEARIFDNMSILGRYHYNFVKQTFDPLIYQNYFEMGFRYYLPKKKSWQEPYLR